MPEVIQVSPFYASAFLLGFGFFMSSIGLLIGFHIGGGDDRRSR